MKLRWKVGLSLFAIAALCGLWLFGAPSQALRDLEATRKSLRNDGFKIDLSEFDLSVPPEISRRFSVLLATTSAAITNRMRNVPSQISVEPAILMVPAGKDAALVTWKQPQLKDFRGMDAWPALRQEAEQNQAMLAATSQVVLGGPIRFEPIGSPAPNALLPYLSDLRRFEMQFSMQAMLELHDGHPDAAWTNLLAATCLVTSYSPEPIDVSHMVRFACAAIACDATWNALQYENWPEPRLVDLQHRWEALDFWSSLPDTAAYSRANMAGMCKLERQQPLETGELLKEIIRRPRYAITGIKYYWDRLGYRHGGSYEDEKALLLYYRDREVELRNAVPSRTWAEMRQLPGVTNPPPIKLSSRSSTTVSMLRMRQVGMLTQGGGRSLLGRAAEMEARRRLLITAIALERYRGRHGTYPQELQALVPEVLASLPLDFMDGKPLRYRSTADGHFVLYSVGLDCADNGGELSQGRNSRMGYYRGSAMPGLPGDDSRRGSDLVWPRPASDAEATKLQEQQHRLEEQQLVRAEEAAVSSQWVRTERRQAKVNLILENPPLHPLTNFDTLPASGRVQTLRGP